MLTAQVTAPAGSLLTEDQIVQTLSTALSGQFARRRVLVLIPDQTRSLPLPFLFRQLVAILDDTAQLDFMVALGTHPPPSDEALNRLVGIVPEECSATIARVGLLTHAWDDRQALATLSVFDDEQIRQIAGSSWHPSLPSRVEVRLNRAALAYDHILILGPTFPHEVAGFSGGAKYLFPGISGPEMINVTHWLGALTGVVGTIGIQDTPARKMIHAAVQSLPTPVTLIALIVEDHDLSGLFVGDHLSAWSAAASLSAQRHIRWCEHSFDRVLSCAPPMYGELWTAAKAMYKLEPVVATGGEVVIYAPHLDTVSLVHGKHIREIGYHILPYFLQNWERFQHIPLGVLAHSTHVRGSGKMENEVEKPNVKVTLACRIPAEECAYLNLGYMDPAAIDLKDWRDREEEGILFVPKAGEILYRLKG
jgi:nickel-dependent lactate racemase